MHLSRHMHWIGSHQKWTTPKPIFTHTHIMIGFPMSGLQILYNLVKEHTSQGEMLKNICKIMNI